MTRVYLSIGSNIDREKHINASLDSLTRNFGELTLSSVYESEAVGFKGANFYNLVAGVNTGMGVGELANCLRHIEKENGRSRNGPRFSSRTLDIDILTYGNLTGNIDGVELPREEILENAFVLQPLAEIAPTDSHPTLAVCYADLWAAYEKCEQKLWVVDFKWRDRVISSR